MVIDKIIIDTTAAHFGVGADAILSRKRDRRTATARHVVCYVMRQLFIQPTFLEISNCVGRGSHAASLHGVRNIEHMMATDKRMCAAVASIITQVCKNQGGYIQFADKATTNSPPSSVPGAV